MPNIDAALVCGHGCDIDPPYRRYLHRFAGYANIVRPQYIVTSGGATQQATFPGMTEAEVMRDFLIPLCPDLNNTVWLCDTESFTSLENVWNFLKIMESRLGPDATVAIYGDAMRALKLKLFASRSWPWQAVSETCDMGYGPTSQVISLGIETLLCYVPPLHIPWALLRRLNAKRK